MCRWKQNTPSSGGGRIRAFTDVTPAAESRPTKQNQLWHKHNTTFMVFFSSQISSICPQTIILHFVKQPKASWEEGQARSGMNDSNSARERRRVGQKLLLGEELSRLVLARLCDECVWVLVRVCERLRGHCGFGVLNGLNGRESSPNDLLRCPLTLAAPPVGRSQWSAVSSV